MLQDVGRIFIISFVIGSTITASPSHNSGEREGKESDATSKLPSMVKQ